MVEIVAVDRADIEEAELLEHRAAGEEGAGVFLGAPRALAHEAGQVLGEVLGPVAQAAIGLAGDETGEIGAHRAGRRRDRHVVVVEDDDQPGVERAGIVHRLIGHAGAHRAVADDRDDVVGAVREIAGDRHAEAGGDRGRGVAGAEGVVLALRPLGEAGQPALLAHGAHAIAPAGQDLVRIGLVADVPDQPVARRVEDVMQGDGQFDDAEPGAEMAAGLRHRIDQIGPQLVGDLAKARLLQPAQVSGGCDLIKQRRRRLVRHDEPFRNSNRETARAAAAGSAMPSPEHHGALKASSPRHDDVTKPGDIRSVPVAWLQGEAPIARREVAKAPIERRRPETVPDRPSRPAKGSLNSDRAAPSRSAFPRG